MPRNVFGFTLIELLVTITIIAILAAIGVSVFGNAQATARDSKRKQDIDAIADSMELYHGHFLSNAYSGLCQNGLTSGTPSYSCDTKWFSSGVLPLDPNNSGSYRYYWCSEWTGTSPTFTCTTSQYLTTSGTPAPSQAVWLFCANLEKGGNYCRENRQ